MNNVKQFFFHVYGKQSGLSFIGKVAVSPFILVFGSLFLSVYLFVKMIEKK